MIKISSKGIVPVRKTGPRRGAVRFGGLIRGCRWRSTPGYCLATRRLAEPAANGGIAAFQAAGVGDPDSQAVGLG
jgi:hypothetical protein